jgi:SAM-dependent methyltransferase
VPLIPNTIERLILIGLNRQPALLLDYFATLGFRAAIAAVRLGVFDALAGGPAAADEVAERIGGDVRGTQSLLEALVALGYVRKRGDRFENRPTAARWLVIARDPDFVEATRFLEMAAFDLWADLEQSVRTGRPERPIYEWLEGDAHRSAAFQTWTRWIASQAAPEIVRRVPLESDPRRLLDVGGGHGRYAAAFCRSYPDLTAVVFDLPTALKSARDLLEDPGLDGRLTLQAGDFLTDALGDGFDVALLINIVHGLAADENRQLLRRVKDVMRPGGTVVIAEQFAGRAPGPAVHAIQRLLDLNYHVALGGRTYRFADATNWLSEVGFGPPRRVNLRSAPGTSLAIARAG